MSNQAGLEEPPGVWRAEVEETGLGHGWSGGGAGGRRSPGNHAPGTSSRGTGRFDRSLQGCSGTIGTTVARVQGLQAAALVDVICERQDVLGVISGRSSEGPLRGQSAGDLGC